MSSNNTRRTRWARVIGCAVAGLLVVGGLSLIAGPTGAFFTDTEETTLSASTGNAEITLTNAGGTAACSLAFGAVNPGEAVARQCKVVNSGTVPLNLTAGNLANVVIDSPNGDPDMSLFALRIENYLAATPVTSLPDSVDLGTLAVGTTKTFTVWFGVGSTLGNEGAGMTLSATVAVTGTQVPQT